VNRGIFHHEVDSIPYTAFSKEILRIFVVEIFMRIFSRSLVCRHRSEEGGAGEEEEAGRHEEHRRVEVSSHNFFPIKKKGQYLCMS
jgi:hypothetical protein